MAELTYAVDTSPWRRATAPNGRERPASGWRRAVELVLRIKDW